MDIQFVPVEVETAPSQQDLMKQKILHVLKVFPYLSPSMLQVGIGTSLAPTTWKPILEELIASGVICREQRAVANAKGKAQMYTIIRLATFPSIHI